MAELVELGADAAAPLLDATELDSTTARRCADELPVYAWEGFPVIASPSFDEVAEVPQLYLAFVAAPLRRDPRGLARLLDAALEAWPQTEEVVLRLPPSERPVLAQLRLRSSYVSKTAALRPPTRESPAFEVRPPREDEHGFVRELLVEALLRGYRSAGRRVDPERARRYGGRGDRRPDRVGRRRGARRDDRLGLRLRRPSAPLAAPPRSPDREARSRRRRVRRPRLRDRRRAAPRPPRQRRERISLRAKSAFGLDFARLSRGRCGAASGSRASPAPPTKTSILIRTRAWRNWQTRQV